MPDVEEGMHPGIIDLAALTPAQWHALKQCLMRRAHQERAQAMREMFGRLFRSRPTRAPNLGRMSSAPI